MKFKDPHAHFVDVCIEYWDSCVEPLHHHRCQNHWPRIQHWLGLVVHDGDHNDYDNDTDHHHRQRKKHYQIQATTFWAAGRQHFFAEHRPVREDLRRFSVMAIWWSNPTWVAESERLVGEMCEDRWKIHLGCSGWWWNDFIVVPYIIYACI